MQSLRSTAACRGVAAALCISFTSGVALAQAPAAVPAVNAQPAPLASSLTGAAKGEYEAGKLLYGDGDFAGALVKFQRAWELSHDARLLWNMAACEKNLRRYARVLRLLQQYQAEGATLLSEQDRKDAAELTLAIKAFVSTLRVEVSEPGAAVTLDDEPAGTTPLAAPLLVDIGQHRVRVTKGGFKEYVTSVQADGASELHVTASLERDLHQGRVIVAAGPRDVIALDGRALGTGRWEGVVPSGGHTLRVSCEGMRAYQAEINVQDNQTRSLQITLEEEKTGTAAWIAVGSVVVAGAALGSYFLLKPKDETLPPVTGTLGSVQLPLFGR